jgi:hypothetical protein
MVVDVLLNPVSLLEVAHKKCAQKVFGEINAFIKIPSLYPIKLEEYQGVVTKDDISIHKLPELIQTIAEGAGVQCDFSVKGPFDGPQRLQWRTSLNINNILVAKGCSKTDKKSTSDCAKHAFFYLVTLGLKIIFDNEVVDGQIKKIDKAMVEASSMREQFALFLEDKNSIKMRLCYRVSQAERELFEALCDTYSLTRIFDGTGEIIAMKNNSYKHEMELYVEESEKESAPQQSFVLVTKEDLSVNSSIRDHIQKFVNNDRLHTMQFPDDLQITQRELIDVLAEKHKLKQDTDSSGQIILTKDPDVLAKKLRIKSGPSFFLEVKFIRYYL